MERHLNLVTSDFEEFEKRILPKFPFCYLFFKTAQNQSYVYEIKDISHSGMQVNLKNGNMQFGSGDLVSGQVQWGDRLLEVSGTVKWALENRAGIEFSGKSEQRNQVSDFLEIKELSGFLKPVHELNLDIEIPSKLEYWLRADGPLEIFIWTHDNGSFSRIQIIIMENFIEWEDMKGVNTARVISKRDIETPLVSADEFVFKFDQRVDKEKVQKANSLVNAISKETLPADALDFLKLKIQF